MPDAKQADYHVHYHADRCSDDGMTFPNIAAAAVDAGLDEICVLKHYTSELPNGEAAWAFWKQVVPEQFEAFLADGRSFVPPAGLRVLLGVESEILDDRGTIAIGPADRKRIDAVLLSTHWLPAMSVLPAEAEALRRKANPYADSPEKDQLLATVGAIAPDEIIAAFAQCYARAIEANPEVRVLAHMGDGLRVLRACGAAIASLDADRCVQLMTPVMAACVEHRVLWELTAEELKCPEIVTAADAMGVRFTATADAHFVTGGWAGIDDHHQAEAVIDAMGLHRGRISL